MSRRTVAESLCLPSRNLFARFRPRSPSWLPPASLQVPLWYVRSCAAAARREFVPAGLGPWRSLQAAAEVPHPFATSPPLHPLYERALAAQSLPQDEFRALVQGRLAYWCCRGDKLASACYDWLRALPFHAKSLYSHTELRGALFTEMHSHLVERGFDDTHLARDLAGLPSAGILPRSGLWPLAADSSARLQQLSPLAQACAGTRERCQGWLRTRSPDKHWRTLVEKYETAARDGRCRRLHNDFLSDGRDALVHPCFVVEQGENLRGIMDCTRGGLNAATSSEEKLVLCSNEDILDFACRLRETDPSAVPLVALADEESAFTNWANGNPRLHIAMILVATGKAHYYEDYALSLGDVASVYGYLRVRMFITVFCLTELFIPCWSYFDDTMIVARSEHANVCWHAFLRLHAALRIRIKGNPLDSRGLAPSKKLRCPAPANISLGELVTVGKTPMSRAPTEQRLENGRSLIQECLSSRRLPPGLSGTIAGKFNFTSGAQFGRVGCPGLAPLYARQHQLATHLTPAL